MKIYLDDIRATPEGWTAARTVEEVQELLKNNVVTHMSLDHDLGYSYFCSKCKELEGSGVDCFLVPGCGCSCHTDPKMPTGYDLVKWMAEEDRWPVYKPIVHSANPVGARRMREDIDRYWHSPKE